MEWSVWLITGSGSLKGGLRAHQKEKAPCGASPKETESGAVSFIFSEELEGTATMAVPILDTK
jgi:hypothetical protein